MPSGARCVEQGASWLRCTAPRRQTESRAGSWVPRLTSRAGRLTAQQSCHTPAASSCDAPGCKACAQLTAPNGVAGSAAKWCELTSRTQTWLLRGTWTALLSTGTGARRLFWPFLFVSLLQGTRQKPGRAGKASFRKHLLLWALTAAVPSAPYSCAKHVRQWHGRRGARRPPKGAGAAGGAAAAACT